MTDCLFCSIENDLEQKIIISNEYCMFLQKPQEVLIGSGVIIPKEHRETLFDLYEDEPFASKGIRYWLKHPQNQRDIA
jgi:diadenosine tetraphosphate (Ap4A) HIT family hydrolase